MSWKERPWNKVEDSEMYIIYEQVYSWGDIIISRYKPEGGWIGTIDYQGEYYWTGAESGTLKDVMIGLQRLLEGVGVE